MPGILESTLDISTMFPSWEPIIWLSSICKAESTMPHLSRSFARTAWGSHLGFLSRIMETNGPPAFLSTGWSSASKSTMRSLPSWSVRTRRTLMSGRIETCLSVRMRSPEPLDSDCTASAIRESRESMMSLTLLGSALDTNASFISSVNVAARSAIMNVQWGLSEDQLWAPTASLKDARAVLSQTIQSAMEDMSVA